MVRLLVMNRADVNAECGSYNTALPAASVLGHKEIVRLLIENEAIANIKAKEAASHSGNEELHKLIHKASKFQSSSVRRPPPSPETSFASPFDWVSVRTAPFAVIRSAAAISDKSMNSNVGPCRRGIG